MLRRFFFEYLCVHSHPANSVVFTMIPIVFIMIVAFLSAENVVHIIIQAFLSADTNVVAAIPFVFIVILAFVDEEAIVFSVIPVAFKVIRASLST